MKESSAEGIASQRGRKGLDGQDGSCKSPSCKSPSCKSPVLLQRGSQQQIQGWSLHTVTSGCEASPERWHLGCVAEGGGDSLHWAAVSLRVTVWMSEVEFLHVLQFHGAQRTARTGEPGQGRTGNLSYRNLPNPFVSVTPVLKQGQHCATLQLAAESRWKT